MITNKTKINEVLTRGVESVLPDKEKLITLMQGRQITLYQGFDPSMPSLHLGNFVGLMKLRAFQKLGHKVVFLVGDFSGMIGDPTDKLAVRKKLTREEVLENAKSWKNQASKLLNFDGDNPAEIKFNSKWLDEVTFKDLIEITSNFTVQQMIERDMFQKRIKDQAPIYLHEFLYPVATAIDCVELDVDLEIGGSDQTFNMMVGRTLMKATKNKEKYVLATKLLVDKEGKKVGKTTGNALFLDSTPEKFFAGIMSFPDEVIKLSFELLTELNLEGIENNVNANPMMEKKRLAFEVVSLLWGNESAMSAQESFEKTFQEKEPDYSTNTLKIKGGENISQAVAKIVGSVSEAKRQIIQNAVDINGNVVSDYNQIPKKGDKIKIGKKYFGTIHY